MSLPGWFTACFLHTLPQMHECLFLFYRVCLRGSLKRCNALSYKKNTLLANTKSVYLSPINGLTCDTTCTVASFCACVRVHKFTCFTKRNHQLFLHSGTAHRLTLFPSNPTTVERTTMNWLVVETRRNRMLSRTKTDLNSFGSSEFFVKPVISVNLIQPKIYVSLPSAQASVNPFLPFGVTDSPRQRDAYR